MILKVGEKYEYSYGEYKANAEIIEFFETVVKDDIPVNIVNNVTSIEIGGNKKYGARIKPFYYTNDMKWVEIIPYIDYFIWNKYKDFIGPTIPIGPPFYTFLLYKKNISKTYLKLSRYKFGNISDKNYEIDIKKFFNINDKLQYTEFTPNNISKDIPTTDNINEWENWNKLSYGCIGDIYSNGVIIKKNAFISDIYYYKWTEIEHEKNNRN